MIHILLADDNPDMRDYLVRLLRTGWSVEAVADGDAALAAIRRRRPTLIVTDVMMAGLDGFGLLGELRSDPATRSTPLMMISARAGEESRVEGLEADVPNLVELHAGTVTVRSDGLAKGSIFSIQLPAGTV